MTGEWVINKRLWKRMQNDFAMNKAVGKDRVILYLHGGASFRRSRGILANGSLSQEHII